MRERSFSSQKRTTLIMFLLLLLSVMIFAVTMVAPYLLAVTMGGILALISYPVYHWSKRHVLKPSLAALVVTLGVIVLIIVPISFFVSKAVQQGIAVGQELGKGGFTFQTFLDRLSNWRPIRAIIGDPQTLELQMRDWIQTAGKTATEVVLAMLARLPELILQLALASIACYFFLVDGGRFRSWLSDKIPLEIDVREKVALSFKNTAISTILATLAAAAVQSAIMLLSYAVLDVPAAFLAGAATFFFAWIPIVGSTPVWVVGAIYLFVEGSVWKMVLMLGFGAVAGISDNFVRPIILKGRSKMHPLVSLVAIFGGIGMFGILGIFIGPILAAILISLLQIWPTIGQRFGLLPELPESSTQPENHKKNAAA